MPRIKFFFALLLAALFQGCRKPEAPAAKSPSEDPLSSAAASISDSSQKEAVVYSADPGKSGQMIEAAQNAAAIANDASSQKQEAMDQMDQAKIKN